MPQDTPARYDEPSPSSVLRRAAFALISSAWLVVLLYHLWLSDDSSEIVLDVVLLGLGLAAALTVASDHVQAFQRRLGRAERHIVALSSSDLIPWECDVAGRITFVGPEVQEHFGYRPEELVGRDLSDLVHPMELERLGELIRRGDGWRQERWRCIVADGSERWFVGSAVPHRSAQGTLVGYTGSAQPLANSALEEQRLSENAARIYSRLQSEDLLPVFQPILSVETGRLIGAEALSRFPGSELPPDRWFNDAAEVGLGVELELLALRRSLDAAHAVPADVYVSLNVSPQVLVRPELVETLQASGLPLQRLVLEITEHASISAYDEIVVALDALRAAGARLAVDDAGAGYASFRHILQLAPEVIKLDRSLIAGVDQDQARRALAAAFVSFGTEMGSTITAEGIETPEELRCLQELGIHAAQGYLFGRPTHDWGTWSEWHARGPLYSVTAAGIDGRAAG